MSNLRELSVDMARAFTLTVGVLAGLVFCSEAVRNVTEGPPNNNATECRHHGNGGNCTDTDSEQGHGHFSTCPEELTFYCIHGECRYIKEMKEPACMCDPGFIGSRCEYLDLGFLTDERKQIIIICVTVGSLLLILFVIFICCCTRRRKRRRRDEPRNGTEKLHMDATFSLIPESGEQPHSTNSV